MGLVSIFIFFALLACFPHFYGYDPMDPNGNITIKWDIMEANSGIYNIQVSILNFQQYRHIENPGWNLSWKWHENEVIWSMNGAEASDQGDCSNYTNTRPHCCLHRPYILDLPPGAPYNMQSANCCKGGVLSSMLQDDSKYGSAFFMNVGSLSMNTVTTFNVTDNTTTITSSTVIMPTQFDIGVRGYTCGDAIQVPPTRFPPRYGHHFTQALYTWDITCRYGETRATPAPTCCVSLSAFYHETIVGCPQCSCGCLGLPGSKCVKGDEPGLLQLPHQQIGKEVEPIVRCSSHMCPIRVHWHVKTSYRNYWRVKMTVTNFNFAKNYSQWNLVVRHPNLRSMPQVYSFNYKPLSQYGNYNDTGIFYGIRYYNEMLLQSGEMGNVQTEMLFAKEPGNFSFSGGGVFPHKILFNGQTCVMPDPIVYPMLPKGAKSGSLPQFQSFICSLLFLFTIIFREGLL